MTLYNQLYSQFKERFGKTPILVRAPGRINLIGEHTDYNDGFVMPAAINCEMVLAVALGEKKVPCQLVSFDLNEEIMISLEEPLGVQKKSWANYLVGVMAGFQAKGHHLQPLNCIFAGNIPSGAGLSSSAALCCGFAYALNELNGLGLSRQELALVAQYAEHHYAGVLCGIMDQYACLFGKKGHVLILDCRTLEYNFFPINFPGYKVVLFDSCVKHALADSEYNVRRQECETGITIFLQQGISLRNLRDIGSDQVAQLKSHLSSKVYQRCLYVTQENERVLAAAQDLQNGNVLALGEKMFETHYGLSKLYEVSCAELDFLVDAVRNQEEVVGARMMGGGFGGCTINIIQENAVERITKKLKENYFSRFGNELKDYQLDITDGAGLVPTIDL